MPISLGFCMELRALFSGGDRLSRGAAEGLATSYRAPKLAQGFPKAGLQQSDTS